MVACDAAMVSVIMSVPMAMLMAMMMVVVGDDDGACDVKHVGSDGVGDDADYAMLIMVAATMMRRGGDTCRTTFREHPPWTVLHIYVYTQICIYIYLYIHIYARLPHLLTTFRAFEELQSHLKTDSL